MSKFAWSCCLILIPIVLVIGFITMGFNGGSPVFPRFAVLLGRLSLMPDFSAEIQSAVANAQVAVITMQTNFGSINDWNSFWSSIGSFFNVIGTFFGVFGQVVAVPVRFFAWVFELIGYAYA